MTQLKANVQFTCTEKGLTSDEKLQAIQNECQQTLYTDEEYDEAVYWKGISIFDTWMGVEDAEERNNTSLDPLYLEEGIDVELLCRVRQLHQGIKVPSETELENYDKLDDCLSINHSGRDKKKFFVMNNPGYETKYHMLPGGWMVASLVKSNSPYTRKVIRNEEGNFEEIVENDRPDWCNEIEAKEKEEARERKFKKGYRLLWDWIMRQKDKYSECYSVYDTFKDMDNDTAKEIALRNKKKWDVHYKEFKKYSKIMDKLKAIDVKAEYNQKMFEATSLLKLFCEYQQKAPDDLVDQIVWEDVKKKYSYDWYERTRYWLKRIIRRIENIIQERIYKAQEEEEATA